MSYGGCENRPDEIADLRGGKIEKAKIVKDRDLGSVVELHIMFRKGHTVEVDGKKAVGGIYQILMDPEGNGPGFLALDGYMTLEPSKKKTVAA